MDSHPALCAAIADRIANSPDQRITFATYMDMALYHPDYGYYSTQAVNIGKRGDFFTSVHLGPDFGELLAEQFVQMWEILGQPVPFSLVEMGAGQGHLALDILNYLKSRYPNFFAALQYIIVEKSPILRQEQQQRLQEFTVQIKSSLEEILSNSIIGCFFSNELVDALPVHQFILEQGQLREIYVTLQQESIVNRQSSIVNRQGSIVDSQELFTPPTPYTPHTSPTPPLPLIPTLFTEITAETSTPKLAEYFDLVGIQFSENVYPEGYRSEVNLAALDWLSVVADRLQRGYVLTIDYGYPASRYYNPRRSQGTLQCYWHHQRHNNPYINIGRQDITAHVDFTALERWGERCGLAKVGLTQQELFLMALGLGDRIATLSYTNQPISDLLCRRDALRQLLDPFGLGGFSILAQSKGLKETETFQQLKGFTVPKLPPTSI
ncbi:MULTISPECIES: class I SAM-dependent methyltransferase [Fischerella]|uniref:SAM-dependent methyltransferase n=1 Tax=Fischerella muscicola CCMEE 5323 TaxID=2019572 RepID=A0A2N6JZR0_FISMU|nr:MULTISPECIES: class I SAM-dependent methyltransferase [Fischerella]MBD2429627.1 class I SAM-dependent methyltransferase [Fischerella sp. FACHB-380]PLZ86960.1 SAM-dependent methyltransferase [Fischerella muscicola CCMEE 5323]